METNTRLVTKRMSNFYLLDQCIILDKYGNKAKLIGSGVYGEVYSTNKGFAVKKYILSQECVTVREVAILKYLCHPNIIKPLTFCRLYNIVERDYISHMYMSLAMCTIEDILKRKYAQEFPTPWYIFQILRALQYCHENFVIHRDVKPANILVFSDGLVQLADFGLAKAFYIYSETHTSEVCTICWRAPEILLGQRKYTFLVDIWSVGVILLQFLTEFDIKQLDTIDQIRAICRLIGKPNELNWPIAVGLPNWYMVKDYGAPLLDRIIKETDELEILEQLLAWEPQRVSAVTALRAPYFDNVRVQITEKWPITGDTKMRAKPIGPFGPFAHFDEHTRQILLSWLWELHLDLNLKYTTLFATFNIIDNFASQKSMIVLEDLQGYGLAASALAIMLNEIYCTDWKELAHMAMNIYTILELQAFKDDILITLDFDILNIPFTMINNPFINDEHMLLLVGLYLNYDWYQNWSLENFITAVNEYMQQTEITVPLYSGDEEYMRLDLLREYFYSINGYIGEVIRKLF